MGVETTPAPAQDLILRRVGDEMADRGFVVAQLDKLVSWARSGSLWPMSFGLVEGDTDRKYRWLE